MWNNRKRRRQEKEIGKEKRETGEKRKKGIGFLFCFTQITWALIKSSAAIFEAKLQKGHFLFLSNIIYYFNNTL